MKLFIRAEWLGDWETHLTATKSSLNLFAATGHFNYAKTARMYLQQMLKLPEKHPEIHTMFKENRYHSVRRSDRYWAGLWSGLIIVKVMIRSIKSRRGLTRGRGFTESTRHQWVHTVHPCFVIHEAMRSITKSTLANSEQYVELDVSLRNCDVSDLSKTQTWSREDNTFKDGPELRSLSTYIWYIWNNGAVSCDNSEKVGKEIQVLLDVYFHDATIKRSPKVKNIEIFYNSVKISDKKFVVIKPPALFLRLIAIAQRESNIEIFFSCEQTTFPMTFFKDGLMRKPKKQLFAIFFSPKKLILTQPCYMFLMEEHLRTKYDGVRAPLLKKFASFMLITSHQNITSAQSYLADTAIHHLPKIMGTQEKLSIRGAVQMSNEIFQQRSLLKKMFFYETALKNLVSLTCYQVI